jgi:hypothetical protein
MIARDAGLLEFNTQFRDKAKALATSSRESELQKGQLCGTKGWIYGRQVM